MNKVLGLFGTATLCLFLTTSFLFAQPTLTDVADIIPPGPNAASLGKYGDIPVSYQTGVPSIQIPLCGVQEKGLSVSVDLSYHAAGIRVGEMASSVGLGWSLNAGGMISRVVMGIPDDNELGYIAKGHNLDLTQQSINDVADGLYDGEVDIFSFNVGGYTGKFIIDSTKSVQFIQTQDVKIEYEIDNSLGFRSITSFTMISPKGEKFYFGRLPGGTGNPAMEINYLGMGLIGSGEVYVSSWYLVRVESADGLDFINLEYEDSSFGHRSLASCTQVTSYCNGIGRNDMMCGGRDYPSSTVNLRVNEVGVEGKLIHKITSSKEEVEFFHQTYRQDLHAYNTTTGRVLDSIKITTGSYCKKWKFDYAYFIDDSPRAIGGPEDKRLRLNSVQEFSCDNSIVIPPYSFEYVTDISSPNYLPNRLSKAIDHWGFYNGKHSNNQETLNIPPTDVNGVTLGQSNRESDPDKMKLGVIKKVTYPTGGFTQYTFEANGIAVEEIIPIPIINQLENCGSLGSNCCVVPYDPPFCKENSQIANLQLFQIENGYFSLDLETTDGVAQNWPCDDTTLPKVRIEVYEGTNMVGYEELEFGLSNQSNIQHIEYPLSSLAVLIPDTSYNFKLITCNARGEFNLWYDSTFIVERPVGGLRVKEVRSSPEVNLTDIDVIKTYEYQQFEHPEKSSGVLFQNPKYGYNGGVYDIRIWNDASIVPLSSFAGYHIGYRRVQENHNGNGSVVVTSMTSPNQVNVYPATPAQYDPRSYTQVIEETFDNSGSSVQYSFQNYDFDRSRMTNALNVIVKALTVTCPGAATGDPPVDVPVRTHSSYKPNTGNKYRIEERKTIDGVTTTTTYEYDQNKRFTFPIASEFANSDGKIHRTETKFPINGGEAMGCAPGMITKNMIAFPIEVKNYVDGNLVSGEENCYENFPTTGTSGFPRLGVKKELFSNGSSIDMYTLDYTTDGNISEVLKHGWDPETYQWLDDLPTDRDFLDWNWGYVYEPNTRLLSQSTDINDVLTTYNYDGLQRMESMTERDGGLTSTYSYHYTLAGGGENNRVEVFTSVDNTTRKNFMDGLGRSLQTNAIGYGPGGENVIQGAVEYDKHGRVDKAYQPFPGTGSYTSPAGAYDNFIYESSPLSRETRRIFPDGSSVQTSYSSNGGGEVSGYAAGELYKVRVTDELGHPTETFTDKIGRVILVRKEFEGQDVDTRYEYDDRNNLKSVMPPGCTDPLDDKIGYQYDYDVRNRMTMKNLPGAVPQLFTAYDERDLLISSIDGNGNAVSYQYDGYGRDKRTFLQRPGESSSSNIISKRYGPSFGAPYGMLASMDVSVLNDGKRLNTDFGYDAYGRLHYSREQVWRGGLLSTTTNYEGATDRPEYMRKSYLGMSFNHNYEYDHVGRENVLIHQISERGLIIKPKVPIRYSSYNIKDLLSGKNLQGLQSLGYTYDVRNRLIKINRLPLAFDPELSPELPCGGGGGGGTNPNDSLLTDETTCGNAVISLDKFTEIQFQEDGLDINCYEPECPENPTDTIQTCTHSVEVDSISQVCGIFDINLDTIIFFDPVIMLSDPSSADDLEQALVDFLDNFGIIYDLVSVTITPNGGAYSLSVEITNTNFTQFGRISDCIENYPPFRNSCDSAPEEPTPEDQGDLTQQQNSLQLLQQEMDQVTVGNLDYPATFHYVKLYEGKRRLVLESEYSIIEGDKEPSGCIEVPDSNATPELRNPDGTIEAKTVSKLLEERKGENPPSPIDTTTLFCPPVDPVCIMSREIVANTVMSSNYFEDYADDKSNYQDYGSGGPSHLSLIKDGQYWQRGTNQPGEVAWDVSFTGNQAPGVKKVLSFSVEVFGTSNSSNNKSYLALADGNNVLLINGGQSYVPLELIGTTVVSTDSSITPFQLKNMELVLFSIDGGRFQIDGVYASITFEGDCDNCSEDGPACTEEELQLQQASLGTLNQVIADANIYDLTLPDTLYKIRLCNNEELFVLKSELSSLEGSFAILQEIPIDSINQVFRVYTDNLRQDIDLEELFVMRADTSIDFLVHGYGCPVMIDLEEDDCGYRFDIDSSTIKYTLIPDTREMKVSYEKRIFRNCGSGEAEILYESDSTYFGFSSFYRVSTVDAGLLMLDGGFIDKINLHTKNPSTTLTIDLNPSSVLTSHPGVPLGNPNELAISFLDPQIFERAVMTVIDFAVEEWKEENNVSQLLWHYDFGVGAQSNGPGPITYVTFYFDFYHYYQPSLPYISWSKVQSSLTVKTSPSSPIQPIDEGDLYNGHQITFIDNNAPCGLLTRTYQDTILDTTVDRWDNIVLLTPNPRYVTDDSYPTCQYSFSPKTVSKCDRPKKVWNDRDNQFEECNGCGPDQPECSLADQLEQQEFLDSLAANPVDTGMITQNDTLFRVLFCDGTERYLFNFQLEGLPGNSTITQTIPIGGPNQGLGITIQGDTTNLFAMRLAYQANGNVDEVNWQVKYQPEMAYDYSYDDLDRLEVGTTNNNPLGGGQSYAETIDYEDLRGNIKKLYRYGYEEQCNYGVLDDLTYTYDGNQVIAIQDDADRTRGFKEPPSQQSDEYLYDGNGNMTKDKNKGIDSIYYNYLNLPYKIEFANGAVVEYIYDATGKKHAIKGKKDYVGEWEYDSGEFQAIYTEEGRAIPIYDSTGAIIDSFQYEYKIQDHLGNTRVTFSDLDKDLNIDLTKSQQEILQENHYYPFGYNMEGPWYPIIGVKNQYQYNGKEWQEDVEWNDYGARFYDPIVARWWSNDPAAEMMRRHSPYNYAFDNPIRFIDPDGRMPGNIPPPDDEKEKSRAADSRGTLQRGWDFLKEKGGEILSSLSFPDFSLPDFDNPSGGQAGMMPGGGDGENRSNPAAPIKDVGEIITAKAYGPPGQTARFSKNLMRIGIDILGKTDASKSVGVGVLKVVDMSQRLSNSTAASKSLAEKAFGDSDGGTVTFDPIPFGRIDTMPVPDSNGDTTWYQVQTKPNASGQTNTSAKPIEKN